MTKGIAKIDSGGQTGADRMGLDWAISQNIPHGGWCPKGRKADDGKIPPQYLLAETPTGNHVQSTEWNARDSDGTLIFTLSNKLTGESARAALFAKKHGKPFLHVHPGLSCNIPADVHLFISNSNIKILNITGPRGSKEPQVGEFVKNTMDAWQLFRCLLSCAVGCP